MKSYLNMKCQPCILLHSVCNPLCMKCMIEDPMDCTLCKVIRIQFNTCFFLNSTLHLHGILYNYHSSILHTFLGISGIVALNRLWRAKILFCSPNIWRFGPDHTRCNQEGTWHKFHLRRQRIRTDRLRRQCCWSSSHSFQGRQDMFYFYWPQHFYW